MVARLFYEETILTWLHGPQLVGFSAAHTYGGLVLIFAGCVVATHVWLLTALSWRIFCRMQGRRTEMWELWRIALTAVTLGFLYVPYAGWQHALIKLLGPGGHGEAYLVESAGRGDVKLVEQLLAAGVAVDIETPDGETALRGAATAGRVEMVRYLVSRGADPNRAGGILSRTPLMNAAEMGHREVVEVLLAAGADPTRKDARGRTAVTIAESGGHADIAERLRSVAR